MVLPARPGASAPSALRQQQLALLESQRRWVAQMVERGHKGEGWFRLKERALTMHQRKKLHAADSTRVEGGAVDIDADLLELLQEKRLGNWARQLEQTGITTVVALRNVASEAELPHTMPGPSRRVLMAEVQHLQQAAAVQQQQHQHHQHQQQQQQQQHHPQPQPQPLSSPVPQHALMYQSTPGDHPAAAQHYHHHAPMHHQVQMGVPHMRVSPSPQSSPAITPAHPSPPLSAQSMPAHAMHARPSASPGSAHTDRSGGAIDDMQLPKPKEGSLYDRVDPSEQAPALELELCGINCNKKFAKDRIDKHREVCAKPKQQRKKFESAAQRKIAEEGDLLAASNAAGGDGAKKKVRSKNPVACPHCSRKFAPDVGETHIPLCAERARRAQMNAPNVHRRSDKPQPPARGGRHALRAAAGLPQRGAAAHTQQGTRPQQGFMMDVL